MRSSNNTAVGRTVHVLSHLSYIPLYENFIFIIRRSDGLIVKVAKRYGLHACAPELTEEEQLTAYDELQLGESMNINDTYTLFRPKSNVVEDHISDRVSTFNDFPSDTTVNDSKTHSSIFYRDKAVWSALMHDISSNKSEHDIDEKQNGEWPLSEEYTLRKYDKAIIDKLMELMDKNAMAGSIISVLCGVIHLICDDATYSDYWAQPKLRRWSPLESFVTILNEQGGTNVAIFTMNATE